MRHRFQFSIATLLLATLVCALFVRFWPWRLVTTAQYILAVWTASTLIQVPLLTWVWSGGPTDREKRRLVCYSIAIPCCVLPIANWLLIMLSIVTEQNGVYLGAAEIVVASLAIVLFISSVVSLLILPLTFVMFFGIRRHTAFWALRLLALVNLAASLAVAVNAA